MKKTFYTLMAVIALCGCSKESTKVILPIKSTKLAQSVSFSVSDFGLTTGNLRSNSVTRTDGLKDQIKYLQFAVDEWQDSGYGLNTDLYRYQEHLNSENNFGMLRDSLQDGRYYICFVGGDVLGKIQVETIPNTGSELARTTYYLDYKLLTPNIYRAAIDTTVSGKPIDKPIVMKRMVGQVTIHLNDAIPNNAAKLMLTYSDYPPTLDLINGLGLDRGRQDEFYPDAVFEFPVTSAHIGKTGMEITSFVFPYRYPQITLSCLDPEGKVIATKVLPKNEYDFYTTVAANTQYKFSGNLFGQSASFNVSVDTKWNTPVNTTFSIPSKTQHIN
ncbi:MAG: hypothetical protein JKY70_18280 [Mucilaginibacter sp.]|nr:hypothetical protein [Mucilaginibacter sp.]